MTDIRLIIGETGYTRHMTSVGDLDEDTLVDRITDILRPCPGLGPGDDAAVLNRPKGKMVLTSDVVTFERHLPRGMSFEHFGWTAAAVNFSDLASMGARPAGFLASLELPPDLDEADLYDIVNGADQCCEFCGTYVIGGDTKPGHGSVCGTAVGDMEDCVPMARNGARPGDIVAVTGPLGTAAAGFLSLKNGLGMNDLELSLTAPIPRVSEGVRMASTGAVTSCMDLSDGLATATGTVCKKSGVGMEIQWEFIPVEDGVEDVCHMADRNLKDTVLRWGGEYELLFTFNKNRIQDLYDADVPFHIIGTVCRGSKAVIRDSDRVEDLGHGFY